MSSSAPVGLDATGCHLVDVGRAVGDDVVAGPCVHEMKNIVICSDGTGNTFARRSSNVSRLVRCMDLGNAVAQRAFYDQGLGTNPFLREHAEHFRRRAGARATALFFPQPRSRAKLWLEFAKQPFGLLLGTGLRDKVGEMLRELALSYQPGDRVFLFGFSRGAFSVRAVAGMLYHCGLPTLTREDRAAFDAWFTTAFKHYAEIYNRHDASVLAWREKHACIDIEIAFLGLWETVKSYGVYRPFSLPHLRHNPIVDKVRHALALDECRAWFSHTTWGNINEEIQGVQVEPDARYAEQCVREVWFRGSHSDVGGGDRERHTARIAFRWMLREAIAAGLIANERGKAMLRHATPAVPTVHDAFNAGYRLMGIVPTPQLHNDHRPAQVSWLWFQPRIRRDPRPPAWAGKTLYVHDSAKSDWKFGPANFVGDPPAGIE